MGSRRAVNLPSLSHLRRVCLHFLRITEASEIPEVMAKAFYIAKSGRPGPVLIDITKMAF